MIRSSLCDYSDSYIFVKGTITVANTKSAGAAVTNIDKKSNIQKLCSIY